MKIVIVRHGQSVDNVTKTISGSDTLLSDLGREQARFLGKELLEQGFEFDSVYASTYIRARETATILCKELGIDNIIFEERFREGDPGIFAGRQVENLTKEEKEFWDSLLVIEDLKPPGGESLTEQRLRHAEAFYEVAESHPENSTILIVGHGGTLYHILKNALNVLPDRDEWFGNCKINIIERSSQDSEWKLTMLDSVQIED